MPQLRPIRTHTAPVLLLALPACWDKSLAGQPPPSAIAPASDEEIFSAAGFTRTAGHWAMCGDPGTVSYQAGEIADLGDFNDDGRPDAVVVEGGTYCFGITGTGYALVSRQADGQWRIMDERPGHIGGPGHQGRRRLAGHRNGRPRLLLSGDRLERHQP